MNSIRLPGPNAISNTPAPHIVVGYSAGWRRSLYAEFLTDKLKDFQGYCNFFSL